MFHELRKGVGAFWEQSGLAIDVTLVDGIYSLLQGIQLPQLILGHLQPSLCLASEP